MIEPLQRRLRRGLGEQGERGHRYIATSVQAGSDEPFVFTQPNPVLPLQIEVRPTFNFERLGQPAADPHPISPGQDRCFFDAILTLQIDGNGELDTGNAAIAETGDFCGDALEN